MVAGSPGTTLGSLSSGAVSRGAVAFAVAGATKTSVGVGVKVGGKHVGAYAAELTEGNAGGSVSVDGLAATGYAQVPEEQSPTFDTTAVGLDS